jgi:hypothetical protein
MPQCRRCGQLCDATTKTVGEYVVHACPRCVAEWNLYCRRTDVYLRYAAEETMRDCEQSDRLGGFVVVTNSKQIAQQVAIRVLMEVELHELAAKFFAPDYKAAIRNLEEENAIAHISRIARHETADVQPRAIEPDKEPTP